jgi:hypothetical protein
MRRRRRLATNLDHHVARAAKTFPDVALTTRPNPEAPWTIRVGRGQTTVSIYITRSLRDWALVEAGNVLAEAGLVGDAFFEALAVVLTYNGIESASAAFRRARRDVPREKLSETDPEVQRYFIEMWSSIVRTALDGDR